MTMAPTALEPALVLAERTGTYQPLSPPVKLLSSL